METDKDLWRENGFYTSSESESGKSDFDEDYYHLRPPYNPDGLRNSNIIIIKRNQFSADGGNKLNIPVTTPCQSEVVLDKKKKKKKKKKKPKSTTVEFQNLTSVTGNVTDIKSNCKPYSGDNGPGRIINLMFNESEVTRNATHEPNQSEGSLKKVYTKDSLYDAYSEENVNRNFSNENNIIAIKNTTGEASESNNSFDYDQYRDLLAHEITTYYLNLEKEYIDNMSCLNNLMDYEASRLNINIEDPPMPKKEITKKLKSIQQFNSTHTIERRNVIVEAIIEVIVSGLRPFQTIFQELWNQFF